jgi:hypothetical protein
MSEDLLGDVDAGVVKPEDGKLCTPPVIIIILPIVRGEVPDRGDNEVDADGGGGGGAGGC